MSKKYEIGLGLILLIGGLSIPLAGALMWALLFALNVFLEVAISLDWAFGIVMLAGLLAGPVVVTWLVVRRRRRRSNP